MIFTPDETTTEVMALVAARFVEQGSSFITMRVTSDEEWKYRNGLAFL
ncbi:MAG: hypothetical protein ABIT68_06525 [Sphingomicrobium sp.]